MSGNIIIIVGLVNNTMKKLNNKGATSILWVILIFISIIIISGFIGIMTKTLVINEIQGIIDTSGVAALRYSVDEPRLRSEEEMYVDSGMAIAKFKELVTNQLSDYKGTMINDYRFESIRVLEDKDTALIGGKLQGKNEFFLEAVIIVDYKLESMIDGATIHAVPFFDFLYSGEESSVSVVDAEGDGTGNVVIRTVSRLALR